MNAIKIRKNTFSDNEQRAQRRQSIHNHAYAEAPSQRTNERMNKTERVMK